NTIAAAEVLNEALRISGGAARRRFRARGRVRGAPRPNVAAADYARRPAETQERRRSAGVARRQMGGVYRRNRRRRKGQARFGSVDGELGWKRRDSSDGHSRFERADAALESGQSISRVFDVAWRRGAQETRSPGLAAESNR